MTHPDRGSSVGSPARRAGASAAVTVLVAGIAVAALVTLPSRPGVGSASSTPLPSLDWQLFGGFKLPDDSTNPEGVAARGDLVVVAGLWERDDTEAAQFWSSTGEQAWQLGTIEGGTSGRPRAIIGTDTGFLAVGQDGCTGDWPWLNRPADCQAVIWASTDGVHWTRHAMSGVGSAVLTGIVAWHGGFVAVGARMMGSATLQTGLVLRSDDGASWREVPADREMGAVALTDVATEGGRLAAVGESVWVPSAQPVPPKKPASAWTSADGVTWTGWSLPGSAATYSLAIAGTPGGFAATGIEFSGSIGGPVEPLAWVSEGIGWTPLDLSRVITNASLGSVAGGPTDALMAGIQYATPHMLLIGSADGTSWQRLAPTGDLVTMDSIELPSWQGDRYYLIGLRGTSWFVLDGRPALSP